MIRHCVLVRVRDDLPAGSWAGVMTELARLVETLPGALSMTSGPNTTPETGMDKGFSEGFVIDFEDAAARATYLDDPEHLRIGRRIVAMARDGADGIAVLDLDVAS